MGVTISTLLSFQQPPIIAPPTLHLSTISQPIVTSLASIIIINIQKNNCTKRKIKKHKKFKRVWIIFGYNLCVLLDLYVYQSCVVVLIMMMMIPTQQNQTQSKSTT